MSALGGQDSVGVDGRGHGTNDEPTTALIKDYSVGQSCTPFWDNYDAIMLRLGKHSRLRDEPLTSRDGRHVLHYDDSGIATLTDTATGEIGWRAGAAGTLVLGHDAGNGVLQVEGKDGEPVWAADLRHPDAGDLEITDDGELELLSGYGVLLVNSRTGPVEVRELRESAPAAAITDRPSRAARP